MEHTKIFSIRLGLGLVLFWALWLRWPVIGSGLPYFYDEDEAHHYNRVVRMLQSGDFNPHYFLKPSLHFYIRLPITAAAFLWNVKQGHLRTLEDIQTTDRYGIAGYSFTASHPGIVKWNRALSLLLCLGAVLFTGLIVGKLSNSSAATLAATLAAAASPALLIKAGEIGVNMPMTFFCVVAVYIAIVTTEHYSKTILGGLGLLCGLALSTKYNALPLTLLPLLYCLIYRHWGWRDLLIAIAAPKLGFLLGTPYALAELPLFLNHFAYEIWHYSIAGHDGHMGEPGLGQLWFYLKWLAREGLGWGALIAAVGGSIVLTVRKPRRAVLLLTFPVLYAALMASQKVNFTRNFLVMIPFVAAIAGTGAGLLLQSRNSSWQRGLGILLIVALISEPLLYIGSARRSVASTSETRNALWSWLSETTKNSRNTAVSGQLWLPPFSASIDGQITRLIPGAVKIDGKQASISDLSLAGYRHLVLGPERNLTAEEAPLVEHLHTFPGDPSVKRIVANPEIRVYRLRPLTGLVKKDQQQSAILDQLTFPTLSFTPVDGNHWHCSSPDEPYCWTTTILTELKLPKNIPTINGKRRIELHVMSPWPNQRLTLRSGGELCHFQFTTNPGTWQNWPCKLNLIANEPLVLETYEVHSPRAEGNSTDERRLGVALSEISVKED